VRLARRVGAVGGTGPACWSGRWNRPGVLEREVEPARGVGAGSRVDRGESGREVGSTSVSRASRWAGRADDGISSAGSPVHADLAGTRDSDQTGILGERCSSSFTRWS
jgi:hypothetical protein